MHETDDVAQVVDEEPVGLKLEEFQIVHEEPVNEEIVIEPVIEDITVEPASFAELVIEEVIDAVF